MTRSDRVLGLLREMVGLRAGVICRKWKTTASPLWVGVCTEGCPQVRLHPGGDCLFESDQRHCPCMEPMEWAVVTEREEISCPYCGSKATVMVVPADGGDAEYECANCGRHFEVEKGDI